MRLAIKLLVAAVAVLSMHGSVLGNPTPRAKALLSSGINLDWWFRTVEQPPVLSPEKLRQIAAAGFRHIRVPVGPATIGIDFGEAGIRCKRESGPLYRFLSEMRSSLEANDIGLVLAPDANSKREFVAQIMEDKQGEQLEQLLTCMIDTARAVGSDFASRFVIYSTSSEPRANSKEWSDLQKRVLDRIAARERTLFFLATPAFPARIWDLLNLEKSDAPNVGYEFHYYEPYLFSHQGIQAAYPYMKDKSDLRLGQITSACTAVQNDAAGTKTCITCTPQSSDMFCKEYARQKVSEFGPEFVRKQLDYATKWAGGSPIYIGEYGVNKGRPEFWGARREDRITWLRTVATAAKSAGFGRAVYELGCGMGITQIVVCDAASFTKQPRLDFDQGLVDALR